MPCLTFKLTSVKLFEMILVKVLKVRSTILINTSYQKSPKGLFTFGEPFGTIHEIANHSDIDLC